MRCGRCSHGTFPVGVARFSRALAVISARPCAVPVSAVKTHLYAKLLASYSCGATTMSWSSCMPSVCGIARPPPRDTRTVNSQLATLALLQQGQPLVLNRFSHFAAPNASRTCTLYVLPRGCHTRVHVHAYGMPRPTTLALPQHRSSLTASSVVPQHAQPGAALHGP